MEDMVEEIESSSETDTDPWEDFPVLRAYLKDSVDYDSHFDVFALRKELCRKGEKAPFRDVVAPDVKLGPLHVQNGTIYDQFARLWR